MSSDKLPVKFHLLDKSVCSPFTQHFPSYTEGLMVGEPGGFVLSPLYAQHAEELFRFTPREGDVWLVTFPRSGTTWMQHLLWLIVNNLDTEAAEQLLPLRSPYFELAYLHQTERSNEDYGKLMRTVEELQKLPAGQVFKSHLPLHLLPPKLLDTSKVVYLVRNPKDVIVSYFHHHRLFKAHSFTGDLGQFAQYFMDDELCYSPYFPHVLEAWSQRHHPNMHFVFYEDMKKDLRLEIQKVASFLNKTLSEETLERLVNDLRFETFSKNKSANLEQGFDLGLFNRNVSDGRFVRKGVTGDWKEHFSPELNRRIDEWIQRNLSGSDLTFVTELE